MNINNIETKLAYSKLYHLVSVLNVSILVHIILKVSSECSNFTFECKLTISCHIPLQTKQLHFIAEEQSSQQKDGTRLT